MAFKDALLTALGRKPEEAQELSEDDAVKILLDELRKPVEPTPAQVPPAAPAQLSEDDIKKALNDIRGLNNEAARLKMEEIMDDLRRSNADLQASLRLTEAHQRVKSLAEGSRGFIPTIPQQEELLKILHEAPKPTADAVYRLFQAIKDKGFVDLSERGRTNSAEVDIEALSDNPSDIFMKHVKLAEQEHGLTTSEAMSRVSSEKPELYDRYRQSVDINRVGV